MKCFEKLIRNQLIVSTAHSWDPLQFAYKAKRSTGDACILLQQLLVDHLDKPKRYARVLFIDYSSAFNTICPSLLINRLESVSVSKPLIELIKCFLSNRRQYVTMNGRQSTTSTTNTGVPQGCCLSPLLFTMYTDSLRSSCQNVEVLKYADDTAIVGLISKEDEKDYREKVNNTMEWCRQHNLVINTTKTKEIIVNFMTSSQIEPLLMEDKEIEQVDDFKYLGLTFDNKIRWTSHIESIIGRVKPRLYMYWRYASFGATQEQLRLIFDSMILSLITYNCQAFYEAANNRDRLKLQVLAKRCRQPCSIDHVVRDAVIAKAQRIVKDETHPMHRQFVMARSGKRYLLPRIRTERKRASFLVVAIKLLNSTFIP